MSRPYIYALLIITVVASIALVGLIGPMPGYIGRPSESGLDHSIAPASGLAASVVATQPVAEEVAPKTTAQQSAFNSQTDLGSSSKAELNRALVLEADARAFVLKAWASNDPLAKQYAAKIVAGCRGAIESLDAAKQSQPNLERVGVERYSAANAALALLQRRCGQFTPDELRQFSNVDTEGTVEGQIRVAMEALSKARQISTDVDAVRKDQIRAAVDSSDPLLWGNLGIRLLLRSDPKGVYLFFDGEFIYIKDHPDVMASLTLVPCLIGLDCSEKSTDMAFACFAGGTCFSSKFDQIMANDAGNDRARYSAILSLATRMAGAIQQRRYPAFSP